MNPETTGHPAEALAALAAARGEFTALTEADYQAAALLLARKLLTAPRQKREVIARLHAVIGAGLFEAALAALTPKQAISLARRITRGRNKPELETREQAAAFIADCLGLAAQAAPEPPAEAKADAPPAEHTPPEHEPEPEPEPATSGSAGAYFGRKAFRTS